MSASGAPGDRRDVRELGYRSSSRPMSAIIEERHSGHDGHPDVVKADAAGAQIAESSDSTTVSA